jgi:hypothetical protein
MVVFTIDSKISEAGNWVVSGFAWPVDPGKGDKRALDTEPSYRVVRSKIALAWRLWTG